MRLSLLLPALCLVACDDPTVRVGRARLPEADGVVDAPAGADLVVTADGPLPKPPAGEKTVRVVADIGVPWGRVRDAANAARAAGARPVLVVGHVRKLRALPPTVEALPQSLLLQVTAEHKACLQPPDADSRLCVESQGGRYVNRTGIRQLVRDGVKGYGMTLVHVNVDPTLSWADAVRAIDGARTCCKQKVALSIEGLVLE